MILDAGVLALIGSSGMYAGATLASVGLGNQILTNWDIASGSELQIRLERRTYLVSSLISLALSIQILSLFLFVWTAERLHTLFVGVMCAAGTLNVNPFGYPTLVLKLSNSVFSSLWLLINHVDQMAPDYPLIKPKYRMLRWLALSLVLEATLQTSYFLQMKPHLIASCCGALFGADARDQGAVWASMTPRTGKILFFLQLALLTRLGIGVLMKGKGASPFSVLSSVLLVFSLWAIVSYISVYFYELPTHHCPFCLLQTDYNYVGYALYLPLFAAGIFGMGVGFLDRYKGLPSLKGKIPHLQRKLVILSLAGYLLFAAISSYPMVFSDFSIED
jgi:hypothetical protein